jgi:hypothetical protein
MSEVNRYKAVKMLTKVGNQIGYTPHGPDVVMASEFDRVAAERDAILLQARIWSGEAKAQRHTVNEIGAILGGIPDWGPVAAKVGDLIERLNAAEQRIDDLLAEIATVRLGPCKMIVGDELP